MRLTKTMAAKSNVILSEPEANKLLKFRDVQQVDKVQKFSIVKQLTEMTRVNATIGLPYYQALVPFVLQIPY
jgi:hypothetical protein